MVSTTVVRLTGLLGCQIVQDLNSIVRSSSISVVLGANANTFMNPSGVILSHHVPVHVERLSNFGIPLTNLLGRELVVFATTVGT